MILSDGVGLTLRAWRRLRRLLKFLQTVAACLSVRLFCFLWLSNTHPTESHAELTMHAFSKLTSEMRCLTRSACAPVVTGGCPLNRSRLTPPPVGNAGRYEHTSRASSKLGPSQASPRVTSFRGLTKASSMDKSVCTERCPWTPQPTFTWADLVTQLLDENPQALEAIQAVSDMGTAEHPSSRTGFFQILPPIQSLRGFTKARGFGSIFHIVCP